MPIPPKKLEAFANPKQPASDDDEKKKPAKFGKAGKNGGDEELDEEPEVDVDAIGARVQSGNGDKKLMKLVVGVDDENNPPEAITDEAIWDEAKEAVEPKWDEYDEPYAVVMHVYEQMGGTFAGAKGADDEDAEDEDEDDLESDDVDEAEEEAAADYE